MGSIDHPVHEQNVSCHLDYLKPPTPVAIPLYKEESQMTDKQCRSIDTPNMIQNVLVGYSGFLPVTWLICPNMRFSMYDQSIPR